MQAKACVLLVFFSGGILCAQGQPPQGQPPSSSSAPAVREPGGYVRRASVGATLSVLGLRLVPQRSLFTSTTSPAVSTGHDTTGASKRVGWGGVAQVAVTDHFAVAASVLFRRIGYQRTTTVIVGTTTTKITTTHEDTHAKLTDFPVTVRYYAKSRHDPGPRWFAEGGAALRSIGHIRTSIDTTDNSGTNTCCEITSATPAHRSVRGLVAGLGVQLIDPVGVRVVPQVRYTRWMADTFNAFSTRTQRHQIDATISLTF